MNLLLLVFSLYSCYCFHYCAASQIEFGKPGGVHDGSNCTACVSFASDLCGHASGLEKIVCDALRDVCAFFVCPVNDIENHEPVFDDDLDLFSDVFGLRGSAWRGKDCNDHDATIYPGRKTSKGDDPSVDYNCNGISGHNGTHDYEDLFCGNSDPLGLILLSDSTGAHFGPPIYPFGSLSEWYETFENELDFPQCSWATGHLPTSQCPPSQVPEDSFYLRMWRRNRCIHRDFQNIAVDGMRSGPMAHGLVQTAARSIENDRPALVLFSLVANDVCNPHPGLSHMTTPDQYYTNMLDSLKVLDEKLPAGSHLVFVGYFHGAMIYDLMHDVEYPYFGITYGELWNLLSTHWTGGADNRTLNPCWGWLNGEEKWRNATTQRADELNMVYPKLIKENTFRNFDMHWIPNPDNHVYSDWVKAGHPAKDLFEPVGGAHPSQTGSVLWSKYIWNAIEQQFPHVLPKENPYNAEIEKIFGDQGGY